MITLRKRSKNCINLISKITSFDVGFTSKYFRNPISICGIRITADSNDKYKSSRRQFDLYFWTSYSS